MHFFDEDILNSGMHALTENGLTPVNVLTYKHSQSVSNNKKTNL